MKVGKIFIKDWLALKPYKKHSITDNYYLKLSNKVKKEIFLEYGETLLYYLDEEGVNKLSCFLVSYFEDIISETHIFTTFVNKHEELYGKKLPFFDTSIYIEDELNIQDVQFLLWYFINTHQDEIFINPHNKVIYMIALKIGLLLEKEYEYAHENILLKSYYTIPKNETDFYTCREMIDAILFRSYLFNTDTYKTLVENETNIIENSKKDTTILPSLLRENRDAELFSVHTKLLSLKGKEWAAEILGKKHPLYKSYLNISPKIVGFFFYKGQNENTVFLEHIGSSKKFELTKKSFDHAHTLEEEDTILYLGIVLWREEWWFSGMFFQQDYNTELIATERDSLQSKRMVRFLDYDNKAMDEYLEKQYLAFLDFNNQKPIAFMPENKINGFVDAYIKYYNKTLNLSKKELKKAQSNIKKTGFFGEDAQEEISINSDFESALVFFNPKSGLEVAYEVNSAFPFNENTYFNPKKAQMHINSLFMAKGISTELVLYCIDKFKDSSAYFITEETKFLIKELDFLLRFFKGSQYHSEPQITIQKKTNK